MSLVLRSPEQDTAFQLILIRAEQRVRIPLGLTRRWCWLMDSLLPTRIPRPLSKLLQVTPSLCWCGVYLSGCKTLHWLCLQQLKDNHIQWHSCLALNSLPQTNFSLKSVPLHVLRCLLFPNSRHRTLYRTNEPTQQSSSRAAVMSHCTGKVQRQAKRADNLKIV